MEQPTAAKYEGWTIVELFGHSQEAGYVTTEYFGDKAMFRVDVPEIAARQETVKRRAWTGEQYLEAGTVIELPLIPGRTRFVSPGANYAMNPATEDAVRAFVSRAAERAPVKVLSLPENQSALPATVDVEQEEETDDIPY